MIRYLTPILILGTAVFVHSYNGAHQRSQLIFPMLTALPGYDSPYDAGQLTWKLLVVVGSLLLCWALVEDIRRRRRAEAEKKPE